MLFSHDVYKLDEITRLHHAREWKNDLRINFKKHCDKWIHKLSTIVISTVCWALFIVRIMKAMVTRRFPSFQLVREESEGELILENIFYDRTLNDVSSVVYLSR